MKNKSKHKYQKIISEALKAYAIPKEQIYDRSRTRKVIEPRQVAHYLLMMNRFTCKKIAKYFNLHYSTVLHSAKNIKNQMPHNYDLLLLVSGLKGKINESKNLIQ